MIKYLLAPNYVKSENDGDVHFISAGLLARLYGVSMKECVVCPANMQGFHLPEGLLVLAPDPTGKYDLEENNNEL